MKIFKYPLLIEDEQELRIPRGYKPLYVDDQDGTLCLWALVNTENADMLSKVFIVGTGRLLPSEVLGCGEYVGSVIMSPFVWHIFMER